MAPSGNFNDTFALAYGSITLLGGLIGYLKANSIASYPPSSIPNPANVRLIASSIFGGTIFYATTQLPPAQSSRVMLAVGVILGVFFGRKFLMGFKIMPAGLMTALRYVAFGDVNDSGFAIYKYAMELGVV
jgi:uncharacterized membrane protein (UPF0136 family)